MTNKEVIQVLQNRPLDENCIIDPDSGGIITKIVEDGDDAAGGYTKLVGSYGGCLSPRKGQKYWDDLK